MDLNEQLKQLIKEINAAFQGEDGKLINLAEVCKENGELKAKYEELVNRFDDMEKKATERKWASLPGLELEKDKFSLIRAFNAITTRNWKGAEFEQEVFANTKTMAAGTDSGGGFLVPIQAIPDVIELLRAESVCFQLGASNLDGLTGAPVQIPKQTGGCTIYWVGENQAITPSDLTLGQVNLTPRKATALVKLSNRLIRMANPSAEALVRRDVALAVALAIDLKALRGIGGENEPLGIRSTPGINTVNGSDASPNFDLFYDAEYELALDNALRGRLGFAFHPCIKRALNKLKVAQYSGDSAGEYVLSPVTDHHLANYIGYPFKMTTQIPTTLATDETEIYFANWIELIIAQWAGIEIMASQEAGDAFAYDQTWIRLITELDVGVRHPESFAVIHNVKNA